MAINLTRTFVAGGVAGLVIVASAMLMVPVVGPQWTSALEARNVAPMTDAAMLFVGLWSVVLGVALVGLYAAVQPRLGPGPRTAAIVSLLVWLLAYFGANAGLVAYGFVPLSLAVVGTLWGLVELVVAGQVGAWVYRDA